MSCEEGFLLNSSHKFYVDATPQGVSRTWKRLAKGINNFDDGMNETSEDYYPIAFDGAGASVVMTNLFSITFTGHRYLGDEAQDYILSCALGVGIERETNLIWQFPTLDGYFGKVVMTEIGPPKGSANEKGEFNVMFKLYGEPTYVDEPIATNELTSPSQTNDSITLSWNATTSEADGFVYKIYRNGAFVGTTNNLFFTDTGLMSNTQYSYYVTTFSLTLVESGPSEIIDVMTTP